MISKLGEGKGQEPDESNCPCGGEGGETGQVTPLHCGQEDSGRGSLHHLPTPTCQSPCALQVPHIRILLAPLQNHVIQVKLRVDGTLIKRVTAIGASDRIRALLLEQLPCGLQGLVLFFQEDYLQDNRAATLGIVSEPWRAFISQCA